MTTYKYIQGGGADRERESSVFVIISKDVAHASEGLMIFRAYRMTSSLVPLLWSQKIVQYSVQLKEKCVYMHVC